MVTQLPIQLELFSILKKSSKEHIFKFLTITYYYVLNKKSAIKLEQKKNRCKYRRTQNLLLKSSHSTQQATFLFLELLL